MIRFVFLLRLNSRNTTHEYSAQLIGYRKAKRRSLVGEKIEEDAFRGNLPGASLQITLRRGSAVVDRSKPPPSNGGTVR